MRVNHVWLSDRRLLLQEQNCAALNGRLTQETGNKIEGRHWNKIKLLIIHNNSTFNCLLLAGVVLSAPTEQVGVDPYPGDCWHNQVS